MKSEKTGKKYMREKRACQGKAERKIFVSFTMFLV